MMWTPVCSPVRSKLWRIIPIMLNGRLSAKQQQIAVRCSSSSNGVCPLCTGCDNILFVSISIRNGSVRTDALSLMPLCFQFNDDNDDDDWKRNPWCSMKVKSWCCCWCWCWFEFEHLSLDVLETWTLNIHLEHVKARHASTFTSKGSNSPIKLCKLFVPLPFLRHHPELNSIQIYRQSVFIRFEWRFYLVSAYAVHMIFFTPFTRLLNIIRKLMKIHSIPLKQIATHAWANIIELEAQRKR